MVDTAATRALRTMDLIPYILENFDLEIQKINDYFENEMPYLNKNLSISQVAVALDMPIRELSYILNNHYNFRFTDFVNDYRIKYIINKFNESYLKSAKGKKVGILYFSNFKYDDEKAGIVKFLQIVEQLKNFTIVNFGWEDIVRSDFVRDYIMTKEMLGY